jgi:gliding motility-associated protein GldM
MTLDIQDIQEDILAWLLGSVDAKSYKFTTLVPLVVPESNYIMKGDTFRANVLLAAYDETNAPAIYVDNEKWNGADSSALNYQGIEALPIGSDGLGKLKIDTRGLSLGDASFKGLIRYQGPDGSIEEFPYITPAFTVAQPSLTVSPTKMLAFYRGVPNPVSISVPGIASDKMSVSISGDHKISGSNGNYTVQPGSSSKATISVSATLPDGTRKSFTSEEFRVKPLPPPNPKIGNVKYNDSRASKSDLANASGMLAVNGEDFAFDYKASIRSFTLIATIGGKTLSAESSGFALSSTQKSYLNALKSGDAVQFTDIKAKLPDGRTVTLSPIAVTIK